MFFAAHGVTDSLTYARKVERFRERFIRKLPGTEKLPYRRCLLDGEMLALRIVPSVVKT